MFHESFNQEQFNIYKEELNKLLFIFIKNNNKESKEDNTEIIKK